MIDKFQWWLLCRLWRLDLRKRQRRLLTEYDHRLLFGRPRF